MSEGFKKTLAGISGLLVLLSFSTVVSFAQEENIEFTAPLLPINPKEKAGDKKSPDGKKNAEKKEEDKNRLPIRYGMSSAEVRSTLGRPIGEVHLGGKLTLFYDDGEIEFDEDGVIRFKWKGKLYSPHKMPELARETAGALSIRSGGPRKRPAEKSPKKGIDGPTPKLGIGKITSSSGRRASNHRPTKSSSTNKVGKVEIKPDDKKSAPGSTAKSTLGKTVLTTREHLDAIQADRERQIRAAGLQDLLLNPK